MPPLEQVGLQAIFDTREFQRGQRIYESGVKQANASAAQAASQSQKSAATVGKSWEAGFAMVATAAAAAVVSLLAVRKATQFLAQATQLAARVETLGVSLAVVGRNAGYSQEQIDAFEEAVKKQGITTQAARQSLLQMAQAQIEFTYASDLARIAQDAAVIANINSSESFQRLVWGIQTGQTRILRTMGITVSFQQAYDRLAVTLGTTSDKLTEQQKVQARTNAVMEAGAQIAGTYEAAMGTAGKQALSLARHIEEITRAVGEVGLGAFSAGIQEITRLLEDLRQWMEENEEELEALGLSVTQLVEAMVDFADLELPTEELTVFVERLTTLVSLLTAGIEKIDEWNIKLGRTGELLSKISPLFPGQEIARGIGAIIDKFTEMRQATEENEKTLAGLSMEMYGIPFDELEEEMQSLKEADREAVAERNAAAEAAAAEAAAIEADRLAKLEEMREKAAESIQKYLDRIADMQLAHDRKLADMADDYRVKQERAWAKYEQSVVKEITKGQKAIAKLEAKYQKQRAKAIADYNKRAVEAEKDLARNIAKAQADFALRERQTRERYNLGRVQSERRYQFERARLVAEGDTLAIEELDARYKLEQEEQRENEALRQKQAKETQDAMVEAMKAAGREQGRALAEALAEQLAELQEQSREEIEERQQANRDRLDEMAQSYAEQQRLADEDYQRSIDKANLNYERQQEDLGRNLARQEELQELSGEEISSILEGYYGPDGVTRKVMEGYYDWLESRAIASAAVVAAAMAGAVELGGLTTGGFPATGYGVGMQMGGVLQGPAMAYVEPGVTEAFVPLTGPGAGGSFTHEFLNALNITGLEGASPTDVSRIARELAMSLTQKIRSRRRN